jgi:prepilin-type N-terminal cleavage/methylation domain-containing protein
MSRARARSGGFTLIEVMAVVFLTSVVMAFVLNFYVELSRSTERAAALTRDIRRATTILDRVARDVEGTALLMKEPEQDPLSHPWLFLAESRGSELGADHVKFDTFSHQMRGTSRHETDLAVVAYLTRDSLDHGVELLRWSSPQLPEGLDRDFPLAEDEDVLLLADGLADFGMRFLREDGQTTDTWDSSTLVESSQLPLAVEIEVALPNDEGVLGPDPVAHFSRTVLLPMRPIDPAELTPSAPDNQDASDSAECETLCKTPASVLDMLPPETRAQIERDCGC